MRPPRLAAVVVIGTLAVVTGASAATLATGKLLRGTSRPDRLAGGRGDDRIAAEGGGRDRISCGRGADVVTADPADRVARDCETLSRRISVDPTRVEPGQHETEVEPDSDSFGKTTVAVFQVGRFSGGAATDIGFSTSKDGGRTWQFGTLPGLTQFSRPGGDAFAASDPSVAYDARHGTWLTASLLPGPGFTALAVSRSVDGLGWSTPVYAARSPLNQLAYDKEWVACDNWASSPFRGNCYLSYSDFTTGHLSTQTSRDGGLTWSPGMPVPDTVASASGPGIVGAQPLVRPDGRLVVIFDDAEADAAGSGSILASISTDGGASFGRPRLVARFGTHGLGSLRAPALVSSAVDGAGRIYATWPDCRFHDGCRTNDVVIASSADGATWSGAARVPTTAEGRDRVLPAVGAAEAGRLALVYYVSGRSTCSGGCSLSPRLITSTTGGASWTAPRRLDALATSSTWLADAGGKFLGDYMAVSFSAKAALPVFVLAQPPSGGRLHEAVFAARIPR